MTALRDYRDALATLLTTESVFVAAVAALVGQPVVQSLKSNRPIDQIPSGMYPCWVLETGDDRTVTITNDAQQFQTIGLSQQSIVKTMEIALVWMDQDRDNAANARIDLPWHLTQLLLRYPQPGGCEQAMVEECQPDRGANHPSQIWRARISSAHWIPKDG